VWLLLLSLPVVLWASSIFCIGAIVALRARTLDMMVLVAVAIGTAWLYSVVATFFIEGDVFYESAGMLATFVLLGHWFEMRARGGAKDAIRALLDLAPPSQGRIQAQPAGAAHRSVRGRARPRATRQRGRSPPRCR
jgi:Cu2+-exporting ATPase